MLKLRRLLRRDKQEIKRYLTNSQVRNYYLSVTAASLTAWTLMFNLGVYGSVFFRTLFAIWVLCTSVFIATMMLPKHERPLHGLNLIALLVPSLWMISFLFVPTLAEAEDSFQTITNLLTLLTIITMPNLGYAILVIVQGDTLQLPGRMLIAMVVIVLVVSSMGYWVGLNHHLFITCDEFTISGEFAPPTCLQVEE